MNNGKWAKTFTEAEYQAMLDEAEWTTCTASHARRVRWADAVYDRNDLPYCSVPCRDKAIAPMIKPQPKGTKIDGWDV